MLCNRCGSPNPDERKTCRTCGHKLQSTRRPQDQEHPLEPELEELPELLPRLGGKSGGGSLGRYVEAWIYALLGAGLTIWCLAQADLRPLYWGGPALAVLAHLRLRRF